MATTGIAAAFTKGISKHFFLELELYPPYFYDFMHYEDMDTAYIDEQGYENYGLPSRRNPGEPIKMGEFRQSFNKRYVPDNYALGDTIPKEDLDDDMYDIFHRQLSAKAGGFARNFRTLQDIQVAGMFINFGYSGTNVPFGSDGVALFSTSHPVSRARSSVLVSNRASVDVDFSISSYHMAWTNLTTQVGPNNIEIIRNKPRHLVVNPSQRQVAVQVVQAPWERGTADRNENIIPRDKVDVILWPYFQRSGTQGSAATPAANNSWFLVGEQHYLKFFMRSNFQPDTDSDINTNSQIFTGLIRFAYGWSDWRGTYGSGGL